MAKTIKKPTDDMENIREDLKSLKDHIQSLSKQVEADSKLTAAELKMKAKENLDDFTTKAQKNIAHFQDYSREQLGNVEKEIKAKPAQSVAIAFGAGLLASFLLSRRG